MKETGGVLFGLSVPKQTEGGFTPMKEQEMHRMCLSIYLHDMKDLLLAGSFVHGFDVAVAVDTIFHIFSCISTSRISYQSSRDHKSPKDEALKQVC